MRVVLGVAADPCRAGNGRRFRYRSVPGLAGLANSVTDCREKKGGKAAREPVDNEPIERFDRDPCLNEVARRIGMRRQDCAGEAMGVMFMLPAQPLGPRGIRKRGWMVRGEKIVEKLDTCLGWFVVLAIRSRAIENDPIGTPAP